MSDITRDRCRCCRVLSTLWAECVVIVAILVHLLITTTQLLVHFEIIAPKEKSSENDVTTTAPPDVNDTGQPTCDPPPSHDVVAVVVSVLKYITLVISATFLIEIVSKMVLLRKKFFKDPWMLFDLLVVLASLTVEILLFILVVCYNSGVGAAAYVVILRLWRIPRTCNIRKKEYRGRLEDEIRYLTQTKMETELKYKHMEQTCHKHEAEVQRLTSLLHKHGDHITHDSGENKIVANGTSLTQVLTAQFNAERDTVELGGGDLKSHGVNASDTNQAVNVANLDKASTDTDKKIGHGCHDDGDKSSVKNQHNELERNDSDVNSKANDSGIEVKDSFRSDKAQRSRVKGNREDDNVFDDSDSEVPPGGETSVQEVRVQIEETIHQKQLPSISRSITEEETEEGQVMMRRKASSSAAQGMTNAAFVSDGDEMDGTSTYRSVDGTPMTDL